MNNETSTKLPRPFWIVTIVAIVWNALGVMAYFMEVTMSPETMAALPVAQQALYAAQPAWVTGAFAIAVFGGLAGSIALAMRRSVAILIFVVSLAAVTAQMFYLFALSDTLSVMGPASAIMPALIIVIAAALVWFSVHASGRSWTT